MAIGKWADATGHPPAAELVAAGFIGVFGYVGTPGSAKNTPAAWYRDCVGHGLQFIAVYENLATDVSGGLMAGVAHAQAALADLTALGIPPTVPVGAAADEHLSAAQVAQAVSYQRGFHDTVRAAHPNRAIVGYGYAEFITAIAAAGLADILWQCGARSAVGPNVHFWQDNTGTETVAGIHVDRNWQLRSLSGPFPTEFADMGYSRLTIDQGAGRAYATFETESRSLVMGQVWLSVRSLWGGLAGVVLNWLTDDGSSAGSETVDLSQNVRVWRQAPDGSTGVTLEWSPARGPVFDGCLTYTPHT